MNDELSFEDIKNIADEELDNIIPSLGEDDDDSKLTNDISNLVHEANEKAAKEQMKKELIKELEERGLKGIYSEDMDYDTLEKILYENK